MNWKKGFGITATVFALSATAYALPWDIDMVDSVFFRGYEWKMPKTPEGSVSVDNYRPFKSKVVEVGSMLNTVNGTENGPIGIQHGEKLTSIQAEFKKDIGSDKMQATGEKMFEVYCQTCHGPNGAGNAPLTWSKSVLNREGRDVKRWTSIPEISNKMTCEYSDNDIYLIIRNGKGAMPGYGHAMYDEEIWSTIEYIREGLQYQKSPEKCK